jgi:mono/diheme cytochrome c family protein
MEESNMNRLFAVAFGALLVGSSGVYANDGKQLYDDFRCIGCHGTDGKGSGASFKVAKPIAGNQSQATYDSIMKVISGGSLAHSPGSCDVAPTKEQLTAISDYVASLPK